MKPDLLIPVDDLIRELQTRIIDLQWDDEWEKAEANQYTLDYYLKQRDRGIIYETLF